MKNDPVDPRVRLQIACWPDDAPRGAVSTFCAEHQISRKTFYLLRARARTHGQAAALEPLSRAPATTANKIPADVAQHALRVRHALAASGLDHGPISVFEKMRSMGLQPPSTASLSRIFRDAGVARVEPRKRPRASYRRFVYPAPNACWQLDGTQYVLTGGRTCVILQLIDDHSRLAIASLVADAETADAAVAVVRKGISAHGVPQRLLTDNGVAFNPARRGVTGQLVRFLQTLGVAAITGKPYKPTTQGKNERFHQTLFRYLDSHPIAATHQELQILVDQFDLTYNTQRPHQALPGRITPQQAWNLTPVAEPPRPAPPTPPTPPATSGELTRTVSARGVIRALGLAIHVGKDHAGTTIHLLWDSNTITLFDTHGTELATHPRPEPGTSYLGNGKPRGFLKHHTPSPKP